MHRDYNELLVGSLTRYYTDHWPAESERSYSPPGRPAPHYPEAELSADVADWKSRLARLLPASDRLQVDELTTAHWNRKCYSIRALILWAAHLEHPELPKPTRFPKNYVSDPLYETSFGPTRFPHLCHHAGLWVNADFEQPFEFSNLEGELWVVGSLPRLRKELQAINKEGWRATEEEWTNWSELAITPASSLEAQAKQAFGAFADCAQKADSFALPLILVG